MERRLKMREARLRHEEEQMEKEGGTRDVASGGGTLLAEEQVISYKSIPSQLFGGPIPGMTGGSSRGTTGRSMSPTDRKIIGQEIKI